MDVSTWIDELGKQGLIDIPPSVLSDLKQKMPSGIMWIFVLWLLRSKRFSNSSTHIPPEALSDLKQKMPSGLMGKIIWWLLTSEYSPVSMPTHVSAPTVSDLKWYSPSTAALILANLVPLYGVVFWGWSVFALLVLFWLEVMLVGVLSVLRMLCADPSNFSLWFIKILVVPCFCILFAIFVVGLGIWMYSIFGQLEGVLPFEEGLLPVGETVRVLEKYGLQTALAGLCASHLFSFFWDYLGHAEFRRAKLKGLMWEANSRVFILFFSLFYGWMFVELGSPAWGLAILVGFKIWLDLAAHLKAHRQVAQVKAAPTTY